MYCRCLTYLTESSVKVVQIIGEITKSTTHAKPLAMWSTKDKPDLERGSTSQPPLYQGKKVELLLRKKKCSEELGLGCQFQNYLISFHPPKTLATLRWDGDKLWTRM